MGERTTLEFNLKTNTNFKQCLWSSGISMATDIVAELADSLAKTGVEDGELSYKGQGRKLDDAQSGT